MSRTALGVALDNQRIGFAVLDLEHLHVFSVSDVWKGKSEPGRLELFRKGLRRRAELFRPTHIAVVRAVLPSRLLDAFEAEVEFVARDLGAVLTTYGRHDLKVSPLSHGRRFRDLVERVVERHPELRERYRKRQEIPGYRGIATAHERYNRQLFLAVAGAEQALADALLPEAPESSYPPAL